MSRPVPKGAGLFVAQDQTAIFEISSVLENPRLLPWLLGMELDMSRVRVHGFSLSLDGFGTGEPQTLDSPFGHAGERLHEWMFETASWKGYPEGKTGFANDILLRSGQGIGAHIMGRNMFSPHRGPWQD